MSNFTLYKRPRSPNWYYRFFYNNVEIRGSTRTSKRWEAEKYAEEKYQEHEALAQGETRLPYKEAVVRFFEDCCGDKREKTVDNYKYNARNWRSTLEDLYLDEIDTTTLKTYVQKRKKEEVSDTTIRRDLSFLSTLFSHMEDYPDGPTENPVKALNKKRLKEVRRERFLSKAEYKQLHKAVENEMHKAILELAVETGMRREELMRLEWGHIDFQKRSLHIAISKNGTKRDVPLSPEAIRTLSRTVKHPTCKKVFWHGNPDGKASGYSTFKNWFNPAVEKAKIEDFRFHDLRHTFATWWEQRRGRENALNKIMGHKTSKMTKSYVHLTFEDIQEEMDRIYEE
ncbi:tyrosine-type recombinase/integrase [Kiloniella sp.]|uniref:tyrosine-type recombinase/integrase n=1 Tax=Kiloniella sp. TaxID=1938587 RepID=UPI003B01EB79